MKHGRGKPVDMPWDRHFFWLAAHVLACKLALRSGCGTLPDGWLYDFSSSLKVSFPTVRR